MRHGINRDPNHDVWRCVWCGIVISGRNPSVHAAAPDHRATCKGLTFWREAMAQPAGGEG